MTRSAPSLSNCRLVAVFAAAGLFLTLPAAAQTQLPAPAYGQADTRQDRIEELEGQLRGATAENERLQYELQQAQREVRRLGGIVSELTAVNQTLQQTPAPSERSPAAAPANPPAAQPQAPAAAAQERHTGTLGTLPATELPGTEGQAYSYARQLQANGRLAEAEAAFVEFLRVYPNGETSLDARYLLAFTMLARHNYRDARDNFIAYLQAAPRGPRAPEAQVRLGMAFVGLAQDGENNDAAELRQACSAFASLPRQFPNAPRYVRELATREAQGARCPA